MSEPTILFEDEHLLAVDKPAGMIVYPDGKHDYPALSAWLEQRYGAGNFHFVHRIDRETSGVLLVAKTEQALEFLKRQFQDRETKKVYRAFVHGSLKDERGIIDRAIGSGRGGRGPRSATRPHGAMREARTAWKRLANFVSAEGESVAYLETYPETGRTHQIRVHCAAIQHPIIADPLYGPTRAPQLGFKRLALHAYALTIQHPGGKLMTFQAPLPPDFLAAEKLLTN